MYKVKQTLLWIWLFSGMGSVAGLAAPERLFYRIKADTNTTITGFVANGTLTWTCAATSGTYTIEATSSLGLTNTGLWGAVAYGGSTGLVMTCTAPKPDLPFPPPSPMVLIPAGTFLIGDIYHKFTIPDPEGPAHTVHTSAFYMDTTEVSKALWDDVVNWATNNGYSFTDTASASDTNYPICTVSWYDCIKWCNARSEKDGYTPVYFTDETLTTIYKSGSLDLISSNVNWSGRGYRLPTEAEWEKAARGGLYQNYFPWFSPGPTNPLMITAADANYNFNNGGPIPCASFPANDYSLYDMSGNVAEWCWDFYDYYENFAPEYSVDPTGPASSVSLERAFRGGSYADDANGLRCASRIFSYSPSTTADSIGFRCVRSCR